MKKYDTHTEAMIFLLNTCFCKNNYDVVFNTNLDDCYDPKRFIYQIYEINNNKSLLNSSLWVYIKQKSIKEKVDILNLDLECNRIIYNNNDFKWQKSNSINDFEYDNSLINFNSIKKNILSKNNIINHSGVCFTKEFWNSTDKFNNKLKYRADKPYEDLSLWYRAIENNINITVINKCLIYYRIHEKSIGSQLQDQKKNNNFEKDFKKDMNIEDYQIGILLDFNLKKIINKLNIINKIFFPNKKKFYYIYIHKNDYNNMIKYLNILNNIEYNIICYNNIKKENIKDIIELFDVSIELNSDYLFIIKNLNINNIINDINDINISDKNDNYEIIKV